VLLLVPQGRLALLSLRRCGRLHHYPGTLPVLTVDPAWHGKPLPPCVTEVLQPNSESTHVQAIPLNTSCYSVLCKRPVSAATTVLS